MIDPRQRYNDPEATIRLAMGATQAGIWTAMPGIIQSTNMASNGQITAVVQLAVQGAVQKQDGTTDSIAYPLLHDVPIVWQRGGNCTLTFPIAAGDEGLVVFASRCIDAWWQCGGTTNPPVEARMHDMSDGFIIVGPFSQATQISNVSTSTVQLRSNDGEAYVELNPSGHIVNIVAPGGINITGPVSVTGTVTASQTITSNQDVQTGSISLKNHVHSGVQSGGSLTGAAQG
jgi:Phage protein Gp138 N-terminal domain/GpV Apex motif